MTKHPPDALPPALLALGAEPLDAADHALIAEANATLARHYKHLWHTIAAAVRSEDGRVWTGIHIGATVGRMSVCAEAVAFGRAVLEGDGTIAVAVAVRHPKPDETDQEMAVVPPCGGCREMMLDFSPEARVILRTDGWLYKLPARAMLPLPYRR